MSDSVNLTPLLTSAEVGAILRLHPKTVERMARHGSIPALRIGRYWRFDEKRIAFWIRADVASSPVLDVPQESISVR